MEQSNMSRPNSTCDTLTFRPTLREMEDFESYFIFLQSQGSHRGGIVKIIPPAGWKPRCTSYDDVMEWKLMWYTKEQLQGDGGVYTKKAQKVRAGSEHWDSDSPRTSRIRTIEDFQSLARNKENLTRFRSFDDADKIFWEKCCKKSVRYADVIEASLFDDSQKIWNLKNLDTMLDLQREFYGKEDLGITTPFTYFGMFGASFGWHTEDFDLPSINYLHFGSPKIWYSIPPEQGKKFEEVMRELYPSEAKNCPQFIRHKNLHVHPQVLMARGIKVNRQQQNPGEFIITFPFGYHQGFNTGFNCAEAVNFAHESWINYGMVADNCKCSAAVVIDVYLFLQAYRPWMVDNWTNGADIDEVDYSLCPKVPEHKNGPLSHWRYNALPYLFRENQKRKKLGLPRLKNIRQLGKWLLNDVYTKKDLPLSLLGYSPSPYALASHSSSSSSLPPLLDDLSCSSSQPSLVSSDDDSNTSAGGYSPYYVTPMN